MVTISEKDYYDKVYACWVGKNCGGTLGGPLERIYGEKEMFDVWWYPELKEGGIPNDDLEIQLIWLKALEEKGPGIKARDLAEYWLDCIQYNFDEYGLHKTNLKQGLIPPISGCYNNWFKNCMGSPIRSEIWACVSPGRPDIAARYAYEDSIVDHAGGESVYGEMFNAAVEAAAFLIDDKEKLLDIGLSYIPEESKTAIAIKSAIEAYKKGLDWREAREYVLQNVYSPIAQYSPVNLGFQTIGFLYGQDFGDAICKAVNCGYDTDCTGATVGSILGIMYGTKAIPKKWSNPLSDKITTNASWGGIINLKEPDNLAELTERVCRMGKKVLSYFDADVSIGPFAKLDNFNEKKLYAPDDIKQLWYTSPYKVYYDLKTVKAGLDYKGNPVIKPGVVKDIELEIINDHPVALKAKININLPDGWVSRPSNYDVELKSGKTTVSFELEVNDVKYIAQINKGTIHIDIADRPQVVDIPLVLLGCRRWLIFKCDSEINIKELDDVLSKAQVVDFEDNELKVEPYFENSAGILYMVNFTYCPDERDGWVGLSSNCSFKLWLNDEYIHGVDTPRIPRPNYSGDGKSYSQIRLKKGWNKFIIKLDRKDEPVEAYLTLSTPAPYYHGMVDLVQCQLPLKIG